MLFNGKYHSEQIYTQIGDFLIGSKILIIQVGDDLGSNKYIELKTKIASKLGVQVIHKKFTNNTLESEIIELIQNANIDNSISGIMIQSPLPDQLSLSRIVSYINYQKDIDGMNYSISLIVKPAVVESILTALFDALNIQSQNVDILPLKSREVVIINDSIILGKPLALELLNLGASVTVLNKYTKDISKFIKQAEIIVSATGVENLIKTEWLNVSQICVDAGFPHGDFELNDSTLDLISNNLQVKFLTPVPGGIGPLTVAKLFENLGKLKSFHQKSY